MSANMRVAITGKQLGAYKAMLRGGPSFNDNYNKQTYGMTNEQFRAIARIEQALSGTRSGRMTIVDANNLLDGHKVGGTRLTNDEIAAAARAFAPSKVRANSRRRTSRRLRANEQDETREIKVYYEIVTPESAEEGDVAESGELSPIVLTHDDLDEDEPSWVDAAVRAISNNAGALEADSYGGGAVPRWFTEIDGSTDYRTGAETRRSFHPQGFSRSEMAEMGRRLTGRYR
jgi:hypothetical protein